MSSLLVLGLDVEWSVARYFILCLTPLPCAVIRHEHFNKMEALIVVLFPQEGDDEAANDNDAELEKRLSKVRRRAVTAARGRRKNLASRNTYKDKGGRSSQSSKVQSQLGSW